MRRVLIPVLLVSAVLMAGCSERLSFASSGTVEAPAFKLEPLAGGKDTVFSVDAGRLGKSANLTWDFGDGTLAYGRTASHVYGFTNGVMNIRLIATGEDGKQGVATRTVTLGTGINAEPTTTLRVAREWVQVGAQVNLTTSARDADNDPLRHVWTVKTLVGGDGSMASETKFSEEDGRASLTFEAPGQYLVKVRVSDPKGGEAVAERTVSVTRTMPDRIYQESFAGTLHVGSGGTEAGALSEAVWGTPVGETGLDAARHAYSLEFPATTLFLLMWNDPSEQGVWDLDLELRDVDSGETVFVKAARAPAPAMEFEMIEQPPGNYELIVRGVSGAQFEYTLLVSAQLQLTYELVAAAET